MTRLRDFVKANPVRVSAFVSSLVAVVVSITNPNLPVDSVTVVVLAALGLGEFAQRVENRKTTDALYTAKPRTRASE
jgi:hypothetical protein